MIIEKINAPTDVEKIALYKAAFLATNNTQLGLDIAWDVWISFGVALFALAMMRHFALRPWLGIAGIIVALAALINNMIYFPWPPASQGGIDIGNGIAVWWAILLIVILLHYRRQRQVKKID